MASWKKIAQKTRVPAGTVLGVIFLLWMFLWTHPSVRSLWIGAAIALPGSLLRLWAAGHIEKGRTLTQSGPYALTRNPLYLGSFLMALGIIIGGQGYWLLPIFGIFFAIFYIPVMKAEELELFSGYGEQFTEYSKRVALFFPSFRSALDASSTFLWARAVRNREHRTIFSLIIAEAILVLRYFIRE
jgi:protein-S-isoprenylcysteine O-methyltransferase Ste14